MTVSHLTRWHIFVRRSAVQLSSWDLIRKSRTNYAESFCMTFSNFHNYTYTTITDMREQREQAIQLWVLFSVCGSEVAEHKGKGYFSTRFLAMSVDGMYQGCIIRNMRTKEVSFKAPFSSIRRKEKVTAWRCHSTNINWYQCMCLINNIHKNMNLNGVKINQYIYI